MARYLGIEVTDTTIKGAVLKTAYKKLIIESMFAVYRTPGAEGLTQAARDLAGLVQMAAQSAAPGKKAEELDGIYAALPGNEASLRVISLPRIVWRRGDKALQAELEGNVPFDIDDAMVDAQMIRAGDPVELLAAAALTARVEGFVKALADGGLDPREVGVGPVALGELAMEIPQLSAPGPVLLVYAHERRADLVVLTDGVVRFARTLNALTTPAARERGLRQSLAAHIASGGAAPVVAYLCGEEANFLAVHVADACGLPAEAVAPMPAGTIQVAPTAGETALWEAPVAVALAARGLARSKRLDFRKGALAVTGSAQVFRERAPYFIAASLAIVCFWGLATWARYKSLVAERDRLAETLANVTQNVFGERVTDPDRAASMARGERGSEVDDPMPPADAYDVLGVLSTRITDDIRHDVEQLDIRGEHVQLQGVVNTLQDRDHVVEALGRYECFSAVRPGRATTNPGDNRQKYTLEIEFRCPEAQARTQERSGRSNARTNGAGGAGGGSDKENDTGASGGRRGSST